MIRNHFRIIPLLFCGVLAFTGCLSDSPPAGGAAAPKSAEPPAVSPVASSAVSPVVFPVVDGLSSASILRISGDEFAYAAKNGGGSFKLNKVDADTPNKQLTGPDIEYNVAIQAAANGKIALIAAYEEGYETFSGQYLKVYDAKSLAELKSFAFNPPGTEGHDLEPLHHRDAGFSLGDKYLAVVSVDDAANVGGTTVQHYISIYDVAGSAAASHTKAYGSPSGGAPVPNPDLGIGTPVFVSTYGDFLIAGGTLGTAVFKINASGGALSIARVADADGAVPHWAIANDKYVLESKATTGDVKIWKWNGAAAPASVGIVHAGTKTGAAETAVRALSFSYDDVNTAYVFGVDSALGQVYSVNLSTAAATPVFKVSTFETSGRGGTTVNTLGMIWNLEHRKDGADNYYVLSGTIAGTQNGVLVLKNPPSGPDIPLANVVAAATDSTYPTAVRTMKTFKNSQGDIFYAAKNYTNAAQVASSQYILQLKKIN